MSDADSNENGYILFEGKRTILGWMIDSAIVPLNGKVHCENTEEGIITKEGIFDATAVMKYSRFSILKFILE